MRAVQFNRFGPADVLQVSEVPIPAVADGEVLIRVHAAGVNPHDLGNRSGAMKFMTGKRFPFGTAFEFAGEIVTGSGELNPGDMLWGSLPAMKPQATGAAAEYVAVPADRVALAPAGMSAVEAASLVVASTTALRALHDVGRVRQGETVLIRGAAGGVGLAAVQIAVAAGAHVTTLSSARDVAALHELGAETCFDYRTTAASDLGSFDVILDTVGTQMLSYRRHLTPHGRFVTIVFSSIGGMAAIAVSALNGGRRIRTFSSDAKRGLLDRARGLADGGQLRGAIAQTYPLEDTVQAHRDQEAGGRSGKRVITM